MSQDRTFSFRGFSCALGIIIVVDGNFNSARTATTITFDPPNSVRTEPAAVNSHNVVAGWFTYTDYSPHGFWRSADGTITTFDVPKSSYTWANDLSNDGTMVGGFGEEANPYEEKCYVRTPRGHFIKFEMGTSNCTAVSIKGHFIAGWYGNVSTIYHGFIRTNGITTSFDVPGSNITIPVQVNEAGVVVGQFEDSQSLTHGFIRATDGTIVTFDVEGATSTAPQGINSSGTVVGVFTGPDGYSNAFLRTADGTITTFSYGQTYTVVSSINGNGKVVGSYGAKHANQIGFVLSTDSARMKRLRDFLPGKLNNRGTIIGVSGTHGVIRYKK